MNKIVTWPSLKKFDVTLVMCTLVCTVFTATTAFATQLEELQWENLLPPTLIQLDEQSLELQTTFHELNEDEKIIYQSVSEELGIRERLAANEISLDFLNAKQRELLDSNLTEKHPEAVAFWDQVRDLNEKMVTEGAAVNPGLNGKTIRMPGYALPLQSDGGKVYEFMLVPYVGACVHTPPPPANQLVFVKSSEGFSNENLYTPVWVEGVMSTTADSYDLSFRDGARAIDAGYLIDAVKVEKYEQ